MTASLPQLALGIQNIRSAPTFHWSIGVRRQAPQREYSAGYMHIPCCSITAHAAASNARHGSFAQRLARSSLHMRHPPRTTSAGFAPCDSRGISSVHPHVHLISIETVYCSHFCMRMALDILTCSTMAHHDPSVCFMDDHFTVTTLQQLDTIHNVR